MIPKYIATMLPGHIQAGGDVSTKLDHICALDIGSSAHYTQLTGIICTIGPASRDPKLLEQMLGIGMNVARLNFSHGSHEYHAETIKNIRIAVKNYSQKIGSTYPLAIALDTKGPEIRTGLLEGGASAEVELKRGESVNLTTDKAFAEKCTAQNIYVDYENIQNVLIPGNAIFLDDGLIALHCNKIDGKTISCTVENGGMLGSRKGVNLPGVAVDLPAVSEKDKSDLLFGVEQDLDIVFASFIRDAQALKDIRNVLGQKGKGIMLVSKIENQQGIQNIDEIIQASDGIMVARGDLGIEIPTEKVFLAQKNIIRKCNIEGRPVICATQMLESMIKKPRPTRAESSDVANAVLDGADCVMLSGETAKGDYPLNCVATMATICKEAEAALWQKTIYSYLIARVHPPISADHAIAIAAVEASVKCLAAAIVVLSRSGRSAHLLSKYRPRCPIVVVSRIGRTARTCNLYRGTIPIHYDAPHAKTSIEDIDARIQAAITLGKKRRFIRIGDPIIVLTGWKKGFGSTNTIRIVYITPKTESVVV